MSEKSHPLAILLGCLALLAAMACALMAVAAQLGRFYPSLDIATHFAPIWLAGGLAACVVAGIAWPSRLLAGAGLMAMIIGLSGAAQIGPELHAAAKPDSLAGPHTLKVIQFNVWEGNIAPQATAAWIIAQKPDIVVLEETINRQRGVLWELRGAFPYRQGCASHEWCSTFILSKQRPTAGGGMFDDPRIHPKVAAAWASYSMAGGPLTVVGVHQIWPFPPNGRQQGQMSSVGKLVRRFPASRTIVAGDFNLTPWSSAMRHQDKLFGLERRTHTLFTWPAQPITHANINTLIPLLPIDHIYAGSDWRTVSVERGPKLGSDHYPVVVTLTRD